MEWQGSFVEKVGDPILRDSLHFWAEWEASSQVLASYAGKDSPKALHQPLSTPADSSSGSNTDPQVFGDRMYYTNCQQYRKTGPTQLNSLPDGSLVVFGSSVAGQFLVDTVLVTKAVERFAPGNDGLTRARAAHAQSPTLLQTSLEPLLTQNHTCGDSPKSDQGVGCNLVVCPPESKFQSSFQVYQGVNYAERDAYGDCFSFVPARLAASQTAFNRTPFSYKAFAKDQRQGFHVVQDLKPAEVFAELLTAVKNAGCGLAIQLDGVF